MNMKLREHENIRLAPINPARDAALEASWTRDRDYLRLLGVDPAIPLSVSQVRKQYAAIEKEADEQGTVFHFAIRSREDDRLIGFARLEWVDWSHGTAWLKMGIGDPAERGRGYGSQALELLLRFAFDELALQRISVAIPAYNQGALDFFRRAGFFVEMSRRQAGQRQGRGWDMNVLGSLQAAWRVTS